MAENSNADFEDVVNTKNILGELGFYQPHKEIGETKSELSKYPNKNLFDAIEKYQQDKGLMVDRVMKPEGETEKSIMSNIKRAVLPNPAMQVIGATKDLTKNYFDLKNANNDQGLKGADKYYHIKANAEAAQRGLFGELTSKVLGDTKEVFDIGKNVIRGTTDFNGAIDDFKKDTNENRIGRELGKKYPNVDSRDLASPYRPKGLNKKHW